LVVNEHFFHNLPIFKVMETTSYLHTFEQLQQYLSVRFQTTQGIVRRLLSVTPRETVDLANAGPRPGLPELPVQVYLAVAEIQKTKKSNDSNAPTTPAGASEAGEFQLPSKDKSTVTAGYVIGVFHPPLGAVAVIDLVLRVPTVQQGSMEGDLLCALVERMEKDLGDQIQRYDLERQQRQCLISGISEEAGSKKVQAVTKKAAVKRSSTKDLRLMVANGWVQPPTNVWMMMDSAFSKWHGQMIRMGFANDDEGKILVPQPMIESGVYAAMSNLEAPFPPPMYCNPAPAADGDTHLNTNECHPDACPPPDQDTIFTLACRDTDFMRRLIAGVDIEAGLSGTKVVPQMFCPFMEMLTKTRDEGIRMSATVKDLRKMNARRKNVK
jgi:hypothetical protein